MVMYATEASSYPVVGEQLSRTSRCDMVLLRWGSSCEVYIRDPRHARVLTDQLSWLPTLTAYGYLFYSASNMETTFEQLQSIFPNLQFVY